MYSKGKLVWERSADMASPVESPRKVAGGHLLNEERGTETRKNPRGHPTRDKRMKERPSRIKIRGTVKREGGMRREPHNDSKPKVRISVRQRGKPTSG